MLSMVLLAVGSLNMSSAYRNYHSCLMGIVADALKEEATPEDLPPYFRQLCRREHAAFAAEIVRRAHRSGRPGRAEADARDVADHTDAEVNRALRRYTVFYTTGRWPQE